MNISERDLYNDIHKAVEKFTKSKNSESGSDSNTTHEMDDEEIEIGKHKGKTLKEIVKCDIAYIGWILNNKEINASEDGSGLSRAKYLIRDKLRI